MAIILIVLEDVPQLVILVLYSRLVGFSLTALLSCAAGGAAVVFGLAVYSYQWFSAGQERFAYREKGDSRTGFGSSSDILEKGAGRSDDRTKGNDSRSSRREGELPSGDASSISEELAIVEMVPSRA